MSDNLLQEPRVLESVDGVLNVTISLEETTLAMDGFTLRTRTFNGTIPGPTLVLSPGDTLNVKFVNLLPDQNLPYRDNQLSAPDESNLHWHGLHVSGEAPSDDSLLVIGPGESYEYTSVLPENHHPGTHWYHPHRHGSTTIQVGGGTAGAILVRDDDNDDDLSTDSIPAVYTDSRQVLMVVQPLLPIEMGEIVSRSRDDVFAIQDRELAASQQEKLLLVNGQLQPVIDGLAAGEWIRLRIIHTAWVQDRLNLSIPGCQLELIAKDGIYLPQIPRTISMAPIVPAGRADIMVQCPDASTTYDILSDDTVMATIQTNTTTDIFEEVLPSHVVDFPEYLQDLQEASVESDCSCQTIVGPNNGINGFRFDYDHTVHHYQLGKVVEREIRANNHPYHQPVYPFQLVDGFTGDAGGRDDSSDEALDTEYYQLGDWHDTVESQGVIRYLPTVFASKLMLHCHRLEHEDRGMMGMERVADQCECGAMQDENDGFPVWASIALGVGGLFLIGGVTYACIRRRRRQSSTETQ